MALPNDVTPPRRLTMLRREADVREIGGHAFRDTQERREPEPVVAISPVLRRFREAADAGQGLSTRAAQSRGRLA